MMTKMDDENVMTTTKLKAKSQPMASVFSSSTEIPSRYTASLLANATGAQQLVPNVDHAASGLVHGAPARMFSKWDARSTAIESVSSGKISIDEGALIEAKKKFLVACAKGKGTGRATQIGFQ